MARGQKVDDQLSWIVIRMAAMGVSKSAICAYIGLSERTIRSIQYRFRDCSDPCVPPRDPLLRLGQSRSLSDDQIKFILATVNKRPDIYLSELVEDLRDICGVNTSTVSVWQALKCRGISHKKILKRVIEHNEGRRADFLHQIGQFAPDQLVFIDESAVVSRTSQRHYGSAKRGERAEMEGNFDRETRYSLLPALSLSGIIHLRIFKDSVNGEGFTEFINELLDQMNPFPQHNSVIVLDNCSIHKVPVIRQMVEHRGMRIVSLPPYSPDYNPIELAFSAIKAYIRARNARFRYLMSGAPELQVALFKEPVAAVYSVTPEKAHSWFHHCGHVF